MNTKFAWELYLALPKDGNLFFSPANIKMALAMTTVGARGITRQELDRVLAFGGAMDEEIVLWLKNVADSFVAARDGILESANRIYVQKDYQFLKDYLDLMAMIAAIEIVDFAAAHEQVRREINNWVENQTHNLIKDLLPDGSLDQYVRMVLVAAIYFKYDWLSQFNPANTRVDVFYTEDGRVGAEMMEQTSRVFRFVETDIYEAIEIPYKGNRLSMVCVIPKTDWPLGNLEEFLKHEDIGEILNDLASSPKNQEIRLTMPKWEINSGTINLIPALQALGLSSAFDQSADFSGMTGNKALYISGVYHQAYAKVDEKGSEMAAATAVVMRMKGISFPLTVKLDHPFFYMVVDYDTDEILFMGRQANPVSK